jgi:LmbE family N-acetylglucosaminyl deacetylase
MFARPGSAILVPDGTSAQPALARTTHLGIGAHADDLEILAIHGILACFRQPERWFCGAIVTDGVGAPQGATPLARDALRAERRREQERAATLGEYGAQVFLDYPSGDVKRPGETGVVGDLVTLLAATRPAVVYTHALTDAHDTHVAVALRVIAACRALPAADRPERVLGCEVWRDLDWLTGDDRVDLFVDEQPELQLALLRVFESQLASKAYDRAALGRRAAHAVFSESHQGDRHAAAVRAMDLTGLCTGSGDPAAFVRALTERLAEDATARITRLSG